MACFRSWTRIIPLGAFLANALNDFAMASGAYSTWIFLVMLLQNSWKSISPFPSVSISLTIVSSSIFSSFRPTVSSSCSSSSTEMPPDSSHSTRPGSSSSRSARQSCLKRQKICRNSSLSSKVMPSFRFSFRLGGMRSAYFKAFSKSLMLTSPPPSLSILLIRAANSWSVGFSPSSEIPTRSSSAEIFPSPPASMLLKRSTALNLFFLSFSMRLRRMSSASAI
mmetsp:Transcript_26530/g.76369  ORF Transcript_26530/g.76369 Transcript_26530/m.76369 type:complete len:223 (+) Transcript_26530:197-865(+)